MTSAPPVPAAPAAAPPPPAGEPPAGQQPAAEPPAAEPGWPEGFAALAPLLAAEAAAEAGFGALAGTDAADLEQAVWLRLLERSGPPGDPAGWVRAVLRAEARAARRRARREVPYHRPGAVRGVAAGRGAGAPAGRSGGGGAPAAPSAEQPLWEAERHRVLLEALGRLPGRCPRLLAALFAGPDLTYREIARELGISQGSLGPLRSRCLGCLRTVLRSEG